MEIEWEEVHGQLREWNGVNYAYYIPLDHPPKELNLVRRDNYDDWTFRVKDGAHAERIIRAIEGEE